MSRLRREIGKLDAARRNLAAPQDARYVLWARKATDEEWQESVLLSDATAAQVKRVIPLATLDGWGHFRQVELDDAPPDFAGTVRVGRSPGKGR